MMKLNLLLTISLILLCVFAWPLHGQDNPQNTKTEALLDSTSSSFPRNVILISWDGFDRIVLWELLAKQKLPNLAALIREGSLQEIEVTGHVTVTKPGHAEMLTGLSAETTGVISNKEYQPIPEGYTIFERIQKYLGGRENIRTIMVTGKIAHVGGRSPEESMDFLKHTLSRRSNIPYEADDTIIKSKGEPFYITRSHIDVFDSNQRGADETGPLCLKYLAQYREPRFFAFLHFSDPDHAGHKHGIDSQEYRDTAISCDSWLGKIFEWLRQEKLYDQTLIYVTTDHGFDEHSFSHGNAPHAWLATNDKLVTRGGIIADIPATILTRYGIDTEKLEPKLIGKNLTGTPPKTYQFPKNRKEKRRPGKKSIMEYFQELDRNGDGKLSIEELGKPRLFIRLDKNVDGYVTIEEMRAYLQERKNKKEQSK